MSKNLEKAKEIIKNNIKYAQCGIYDTSNIYGNWRGDIVNYIYDADELVVSICYDWDYFEVFGLGSEFEELKEYYDNLINEIEKDTHDDVIYFDYVITWVDYMECYRIYNIKNPNQTIAYSDDDIETIEREIDRQCRFIKMEEEHEQSGK